MFKTLSKIFLYASLLTPLLLVKPTFFPFIAAKAVAFRFCIELAVLFFLIHVLAHLRNRAYMQALIQRLKHPFVICIGVFAVAVTVTALIGVNPTQSFWSNFERGEGAFQMLHYAAFFILAALMITDRKSIERFMLTTIWVSVPMCLYALLQLTTDPSPNNWFVIAPGDRVSGTLGNPSYLAAYLIFCLTFILYFIYTTKDHINRVLWSVLFLFEGFILLKTGTRGAFLGLVVSVLLLAAINVFLTHNKKMRYALLACFAAGAAMIAIFFATNQAPFWRQIPVLNRLVNFNSAVNDIRPRIWTWESALSGAIEKPVAGWGAENFPYAFDKYYNPNHYGIESFFDRTHNSILEYLITGGLLVLLPWLLLMYYYYRRLAGRPKNFWYSVMLTVPVCYLIQSFFLFDTLPIYLAYFSFLICAMNTEPGAEAIADPDTDTLTGAGPVVLATVLCLATAALIYSTAVRPLTKNQLLSNALRLQNTFSSQLAAGRQPSVNPQEIMQAFHTAMAFASPIGQEEAVGMYQKFVLSLVESASQNRLMLESQQARSEILFVVKDVNAVHDANLHLYPGLKQQYINGGINLRAGTSFNLPELTARGKALFTQAVEQAPTRLEFIRVLLELARMENDTAAFTKWAKMANLYRPDLFQLNAPAK